MKQQRHWFILAPILGLAAFVRFYGLDFGLPNLLHVDEPFEVHRALRLASGEFDFNRAGKGGLYYFLFIEMGLIFLLLYVTGVINGVDAFIDYYIRHEHVFYFAGRVTIALFGLLSVYILYQLGKMYGGRTTGLMAAFFLALNPLHIENSHYATVDVLMVFFMLPAWVYLYKIFKGGGQADYVKAGIFFGLSVITKLPAILFLIPLLLFYVFSVLETRTRHHFNCQSRNMFILLFVAGILTAVGEPGYVKGMRGTLKSTLTLFSEKQAIDPALPNTPSHATLQSGAPGNTYAYYFDALKKDVGIPMLMLFAVALIFWVIKKDRFAYLMLSFMVVYLFIISGTTAFWHYQRYLLPVSPLIFLISARGISEAAGRLAGSFGAQRALFMAGLFSVLVISPIYAEAIQVSRSFGLPNTKMLAKQWINEHIPDGSRIMMDGSPEHPSQSTVPIVDSPENVLQMVHRLEKNNTGKARYWRKRAAYLSSLDLPRYDIVFVHNSEYWPVLNEIKQRQIGYIIVNVGTLSMGVSEDMRYLTSRIDFYRELTNADGVERIMVFQEDGQSSGQTIEIYKMNG